VLDHCKVTQYSKILEDSVQGKMHHLPLGMRLHRNISKGGGARPGDGAPGVLSKMRVTIFSGSQVVWGGKKYVGAAVQIESEKYALEIVVCIYITSIS